MDWCEYTTGIPAECREEKERGTRGVALGSQVVEKLAVRRERGVPEVRFSWRDDLDLATGGDLPDPEALLTGFVEPISHVAPARRYRRLPGVPRRRERDDLHALGRGFGWWWSRSFTAEETDERQGDGHHGDTGQAGDEPSLP